jgi:hypothetical protein
LGRAPIDIVRQQIVKIGERPAGPWEGSDETMKTTLILMLAGALIGIVAASFLVPPALAWYTAPGGLPQGAQIPAVVQIPEVIRYATGKLLYWQFVGGAIGAGLGLVAGLVSGFRGRPVTAAPATRSTAA